METEVQSQEYQKYIRLPYAHMSLTVGGKKIRRSAVFTLGKVYSFSSEETRCRSKEREFAEDFGVSERTISRSVQGLMNEHIIERGQNSTYNYIGDEIDHTKGQIIVDYFMLAEEFEIRAYSRGKRGFPASKRRLTLTEVLVFSKIKTHCRAQKSKTCKISIRSMAQQLNISKCAAANAIDVLLHAELIHRACKAQNGAFWSEYTLDEKIQRRLERQVRRAPGGSVEYVDKRTKIANEATERAKYYADIQSAEDKRIEAIKKPLETDPEYRAAQQEMNASESKLAKAEFTGDKEAAQKIRERRKELNEIILDRYGALNVDRKALQRRYRCERCKDTGETSNGCLCDCWRR